MTVADKLHQLTGLSADDVAEVLQKNSRAYMSVRGAVAEKHLENHLRGLRSRGAIKDFNTADGDFDKDFIITTNSDRELTIECKNAEVRPISKKADLQSYILYCIREDLVDASKLSDFLLSFLSTATHDLTDDIMSLKVAELKRIVQWFPQELRASGLARFHFSADRISPFQSFSGASDFIAQFTPPLSVDFMKTRNSKLSGERRYYSVGEIDVVAVCLFSRTLHWEFLFGQTDYFEKHTKYPNRYSNKLNIYPGNWYRSLADLLLLL